jgi:tryptophan halogenase
MSQRPIRDIVILGGGTAGWMTAAALSKALTGSDVRISLVESDAIGTIGVGEATIPTIHWFNQLIGLDEAAFMAATKATYKLGIEFLGWQGDGHSYFHPFGTYGGPGDALMFPQKLIRAWQSGLDASPEPYSLTTQLARARRFARPVGDPRSLLSTLGFAYHFDAGLYAAYLRGQAEGRGVVRHEGKVGEIEQDGTTGFIRSLITDKGTRLAGDLFIDCSGLRGLLIEDRMQAGYDDWSDWLPCDGAWAAPTPADAEPVPFTRSYAEVAGWRWRIPLQHRVGNGYVFSSRFQAPEAARETLLAAIGEPMAEPRLIRFTPGKRRRAWIGNVIAIGLSSGFLEPLESTSIHLIQTGIGKLLSLFPRADCDPLLAEQYNRIFAREMDDVRDFLVLHYSQTTGRTEPMWRHCQTTALPETLAYKIDQYRASGRIMLGPEDLFRDASWFAVMTGQGVRATDYNPMLDSMSDAANLQHLAAVRAAIDQSAGQISKLP